MVLGRIHIGQMLHHHEVESGCDKNAQQVLEPFDDRIAEGAPGPGISCKKHQQEDGQPIGE